MRYQPLIQMLAAVALVAWVGTRAVADEAAELESPISDSDREHWSFQPLGSPAPPEVSEASWPRNAIDQFILAKLEALGLSHAPAADRTTLIRRVTFDLTGLPPTPDEVAAFVGDERPDAYERVLDRLLASRQYGERWAQHWLDLARYADTDGFEHDLVRPTAWKYRDWVIQALNDDLPYDEFVRRQIAGDVLYPGNEAAAIATGFALCGPDMPDINRVEDRRHMVLNEITATVGSVFLGLQIGCAECHDHKFDPLSQADFYRLRACFEPAVRFGQPGEDRVLRESPKKTSSPSFLYARGDVRRPTHQVEAAFPRIANPWRDAPRNSSDEAPSLRVALARWLTRPDHPLATRVMVNRLWQHHFGEGLVATPSDFGVMGDSPTHPELLDWLAGELPRQGWSLKRMHKLLLTSATYQQASRLPEDAPETERRNWAHALESDPGNRWLSRMRRRRLEGEAIRDGMLAAAGRLSSRAGGPGVLPPLPGELVSTLLKDQWTTSADEEDHRRRSVYLFARRNLRYPIFEAFDRPEAASACPRRSHSTTAPQALLLLNSEFSLQCAKELAKQIVEQTGAEPNAGIDLAYRRTLGRPPSSEEQARAHAFLEHAVERNPRHTATDDVDADDSLGAALSQLCLALFNLNEFVYLD